MKPEKKVNRDIIWLLTYTKAKQEMKALENLEKQGFKSFLPLIPSTNKNDKDHVLIPVFPRYLFVQINKRLDNWTSINSTLGVNKIVMFGGTFAQVPNSIINKIKKRLNQKGIFNQNFLKVDYKKGDKLTLKEGSFSGVDAIFLSNKSKDRVRLLLKLVNTSVITEVAKSDIGHKELVEKFKL